MNKPQPEFKPLSKEIIQSIKTGDVIERMLSFTIPMYLIVTEVNDKFIYCGTEEEEWKFERERGIEVDDDIPITVSYIAKVLNEEEKIKVKNLNFGERV